MSTTQSEKDSLNQWNSQLNTETMIQNTFKDFPGRLVVKILPSNAGDMDSIPAWGANMSHGQKTKTLKKKNTQKQFSNKFNRV